MQPLARKNNEVYNRAVHKEPWTWKGAKDGPEVPDEGVFDETEEL